MENEDILDSNVIDQPIKLVHASKTKRLLNLIIDYILFIIGFTFTFAFAIFGVNLIEGSSSFSEEIFRYLFGYILYLAYYLLTEGIFKGKSPAKFITGTRVLNYSEDSIYPNMKTIFLRSLSRLVPFESFSFLGDTGMGWHDRWTNTIVIDEKNPIIK